MHDTAVVSDTCNIASLAGVFKIDFWKFINTHQTFQTEICAMVVCLPTPFHLCSYRQTVQVATLIVVSRQQPNVVSTRILCSI